MPRFLRRAEEIDVMLRDATALGHGALARVIVVIRVCHFDEAQRIMADERLRNALRLEAEQFGIGTEVEGFIAAGQYDAVRRQIATARRVDERRQELARYRERIDRLPPHSRPQLLDLHATAMQHLDRPEREYGQAVHPLRRQLGA
ncbi:MAG: hypothetical protein AAB839_01775 [Patescibacteria group bacterium]